MTSNDLLNASAIGAFIQGQRSTVLNSLGWMALLFLVAVSTTASIGRAPSWVLIVLVACLVIDFALFIAAYIYFGLTNPDALRSERFGIQKMQIEKGFIGDSVSGFGRQIDATATANPKLNVENQP